MGAITRIGIRLTQLAFCSFVAILASSALATLRAHKESREAVSVGAHQDLVIVSSQFREDVTWLYDGGAPVVVCSKTRPSPLCPLRVNRGNEATAYLKFIIENYERLPKHVAFVHGHERAWHHNAKTGLVRLITQCADYSRHGFVSLNLKYIDDKYPGSNDSMDLLHRLWDDLFRPYLERDPPEELVQDCCAQFIVSRRRILARPREAYVKWYDFLVSADHPRVVGVMFEYMWPVIFGEPDVVTEAEMRRRFRCGV